MFIFVPLWAIWFILAAVLFIIAGIVLKNSSGLGSLSIHYYDPIGMFIFGALLTGGLSSLGIGIWVLVTK